MASIFLYAKPKRDTSSKIEYNLQMKGLKHKSIKDVYKRLKIRVVLCWSSVKCMIYKPTFTFNKTTKLLPPNNIVD